MAPHKQTKESTMTVAYEIGTKFLNKDSSKTGLEDGYVLEAVRVKTDDLGRITYTDDQWYGVDQDWVELGYVEVI
jgi:hypothetical protein